MGWEVGGRFKREGTYVSVQFSCSVVSLCNPMDCCTPGFLVHHQFPELAQTHVHRVGDAIQPSHPLSPPSLPSISRPASRSSPVSQFFTTGGQSIGASASASVLPINIKDWFPLGLTGLISLQSKGLSQESSPTPQFKSINSELCSLLPPCRRGSPRPAPPLARRAAAEGEGG